MDQHKRVFRVLCIIITLWSGVKALKVYGERCSLDSECSEPLACRPQETLFVPVKVCRCGPGLEWRKTQCLKATQKDEEAENEVAELVTILVPVIASVLLTLVVACACCCWVHNSTKKVEKEMVRTWKESLYDPEEELMETKAELVVTTEKETKERPKTTKERPKTSNGTIKNKKEKEPSVAVTESSRECLVQSNGGLHLSNGAMLSNGAIVKNRLGLRLEMPVEQQHDAGYQANMRFLLARPHSSTVSEPRTRPVSANVYNDQLLVPREKVRSSSASSVGGHRSPGIIGPYVTDPTRLRSRASTASSLQHGHELTHLYDKIVAVAEAEKKQDNTATDGKEKQDKKIKKKKKKKDTGIEEIKLVRVAVSAFKRRKRLRDIPQSERMRNKKSAFESVVERVMRIREEEKATTYRRPKRAHTTSRPGTRSSTATTTTSSVGSSNSTLKDRPESVAQRILRERRESGISAKTPVTPKDSRLSSAQRKRASAKASSRQPLHVALRYSADRHAPRAIMTQKIKQQAHFSAVKNFQVPPLPPDLAKRVDLAVQKSAVGLPSPNKQVKSILKKTSNGQLVNGNVMNLVDTEDQKTEDKKKKNSHVNYAFDLKDENPDDDTMTKLDKKRDKPTQNGSSHRVQVDVH